MTPPSQGRSWGPILPIPPKTLSEMFRSMTIRWRHNLQFLEILSDPCLDLVLIKVNLALQLGPSCVQPSPKERAKNCGSLVVSNGLPRARCKQCLILAYTSLTTSEPYAKAEPSKMALNIDEMMSTVFYFIIFVIFSFT